MKFDYKCSVVSVIVSAKITCQVSAFPSTTTSYYRAGNNIQNHANHPNNIGTHLCNANNNDIESDKGINTSRRTFMGKFISSAGLASFGFFGNMNIMNTDHGIKCQCTSCNLMVMGSYSNTFGPPPVMAFETKDQDGTQRSADYYAQVIQMRETNARLQASGYQLDSREEEQAKINSAFASFSYDESQAKSSKSSKGTNKSNMRYTKKKE